MSKKILILQEYLFANTDANSKLVFRICKQLLGMGYDVSVLGVVHNEAEHVSEYQGIHFIHEPDNRAAFVKNLSNRLGRFKFLRFILCPRSIWYRYHYGRYMPFFLEARRWLRKHVSEYDALIACCSPYYLLQLASEVADRVPVIYYKIDPVSSIYRVYDGDCALATVENEMKWDSVAMRIMMPDVVYRDYMRLPTKINGSKVRIVQFPNVRPLSVISNQQSVISSQLDNTKCNLFFIGKFYADIRHPQYLFDLMGKLMGTGIVLHVVGPINNMGLDEKYIEKYFTNKIENIRYHGAVPPAEADALLTQADVLVHVGNAVDSLMPSKILDYISSGKPILNICKIRTCPTIPLMERYPMGLTLFEPSVVSDQLSVVSSQSSVFSSQQSVISDHLAEQVKDFCMKNKGKQIPYEQIEKLYPECTIEYVGKQFNEAIQDVIKEFKQK